MKKILLTILAGAMFLSLTACGGSSSSSKPWRELGVSEREYKEIYNYHKKYGK